MRRSAELYHRQGRAAVEVKLYDGARHEILNETNAAEAEVRQDLIQFLLAALPQDT